MPETVYIFGAGINRGVNDWHGLVPPLATDFFQQAFHSDKYFSEHYLNKIQDLTKFIQKFWKLSIEDLKKVPFDLEACFTLIQLQSIEAQQNNDKETAILLSKAEYQLTSLLAEFLSEFEHFIYSDNSFRHLGKILFNEKPTILTFNYDTLLESAIESASGVNPNIPELYKGLPPENDDNILDEELVYSHCNWNRPLAYGEHFDIVQLQRAGISTYVKAQNFYRPSANNLYSSSILKLHGSLNWFTFSGIPKYQIPEMEFFSMKGKTVMCTGHWWFNEPPDINQEILIPIILTPALYKQIYQNRIISSIWKKAIEGLKRCKRLIIGGYSFPPTDFHTKRLFLESFQKNVPNEIIVINPDTSIIKMVKELCHFERPVLACKNLDEFIELYNL